MSHSPTHFHISELRQRSLVCTIEAIMVLFGSIIAIVVLPNLLLKYLYDTTQLVEMPKELEMIPVVAFVIAAFYFFKALIGNMRREKQVKLMQLESEMSSDCCGGHGDSCCSDGDCKEKDEAGEDWDEDLKELEDLLAEVEEEEKTEKKSVKKAPAKSAKKASKK